MRFSTSEGRFDRRIDNQGNWSSTKIVTDMTGNYFAGELDREGNVVFRNFFTFDLSRLNRCAEAAKLVVRTYRGRGDRQEVLGLFHVATPARRLDNNEGRRSRIIVRDLGTGTRYGRHSVATEAPGVSLVRLHLNAAAVADINAARGECFSFAGSVLSLSTEGPESLFGWSTGRSVQRLVVRVRAQSVQVRSGIDRGSGNR